MEAAVVTSYVCLKIPTGIISSLDREVPDLLQESNMSCLVLITCFLQATPAAFRLVATQHRVPCYLDHRLTVLMIPAKTRCPNGWNKEYGGYLVSEFATTARKRSSYVCWDKAPEVAAGGKKQNQHGSDPLEGVCRTMPCAKYFNDRELTCVFCRK